MSGKNENMEVSGGEDAETEYLQGMTSLEDSLDHSIDSLQGSLTLPTFTMGQSSELAGSQGFQISNSRNFTLSQRSNDFSLQKKNPAEISQIGNTESGGFVLNPGHVTSGVGHVTSGVGHVTSGVGHVTSGVNLQGNTLIFQGSQFGALNMVQTANQYQIVLPSESKELNSGQQLVRNVAKSEVGEPGHVNEVFEGGSSDEKSGRCKTSPKHRGKKSRSTSSSGYDMTIKSEPGPSPCRMETSESQQSGADVGFKPSLLDEILTEKKMVLMRSPEVIQFLQAQQQQQQTREKSVIHRQSSNS